MSTTVVLDTEAVSLLTPERRHDPGRRRLLAHLEGADAVLAPSVVRVEACVPRDARHVDVNRLVRDAEDDPRLRHHAGRIADAAATVRVHRGTQVAVVDALVGAVAARVARQAQVEVLTSDPADLTAVCNDLGTDVAVRRL